jgi:hypothetical protein
MYCCPECWLVIGEFLGLVFGHVLTLLMSQVSVFIDHAARQSDHRRPDADIWVWMARRGTSTSAGIAIPT